MSMAGKGFCVGVQLDLHAVTCPGVWLCPNGKVALKINIFDSFTESRKLSPVFPLLFHDRFTFKKVFSSVATLTEVERCLQQEFIYAELLQWPELASRPIVLATFETNLVELLYPAPSYKSLVAGVDVDLLMESSKCFPGILAPKIEISTRTTVEEVLGLCDTRIPSAYVVNPKVINSKPASCVHRKQPAKGIIRQKRVCHSQGKFKDNSKLLCCKKSSSMQNINSCSLCSSHQRVQPPSKCCHTVKKTSDTCDLSSSNQSKNTYSSSTHFRHTCPICQKYNCYFIQHENAIGKNLELYSRERHSYSPSRVNISRVSPTTTDTIDFYDNLQRFYKRMYKQAKSRAHEEGHCV